ncbi:MAG: preprotein translocase subunit SecE [Terracidiphilus sp.]|jgi:preprotein translocase subunit SecE
MATKTAIEKGEERSAKRREPNALQEWGGNAMSAFSDFTGFLRDVRAEMKKVVTPTWKEVRATTGVVIVAVFLFGLFFFIVDGVFRVAVYGLLGRLGGLQ